MPTNTTTSSSASPIACLSPNTESASWTRTSSHVMQNPNTVPLQVRDAPFHPQESGCPLPTPTSPTSPPTKTRFTVSTDIPASTLETRRAQIKPMCVGDEFWNPEPRGLEKCYEYLADIVIPKRICKAGEITIWCMDSTYTASVIGQTRPGAGNAQIDCNLAAAKLKWVMDECPGRKGVASVTPDLIMVVRADPERTVFAGNGWNFDSVGLGTINLDDA